MSLLELEHVGKSYRKGPRQQNVLTDIDLQIEPGEHAVIWGPRRSGRSTLLRIAAGIQPPDHGTVRFEGQDLTRHPELLGEGIGYCQPRIRAGEGRNVLEQITLALLAKGTPPPKARSQAQQALARTGAEDCATLTPEELDSNETLRVSLARALAPGPRLIVTDEPTTGTDATGRDSILALLRSLTQEGIAVLASTSESAGLAGAERTYALSDGRLRGTPAPELATVVHLDSARRAHG